MDYAQILFKLIGPIRPVGDTRIDDERFENLQELGFVVDEIIYELKKIREEKDRQEYSVKECGKLANQILENIKIEL